MKNKYIFPLIVFIFILELFVFKYSKSITSNETIFWQLAARYSARITFYILSFILFWTGIKGLKSIYLIEKKRLFLMVLILLLTINHLIHFYFIYKNFELNNYAWFIPRHLAGAIVYPVLVFTPFYFWNKKVLSKKLYRLMYLFFVPILTIFTVSYIGRLTNDLPFRSSNNLFYIHLVIIALLWLLNIWRIFSESKK